MVDRVALALERVGDFRTILGEAFDEAFTHAAPRKAETIGRPSGSPEWRWTWKPGPTSIFSAASAAPNPWQSRGFLNRHGNAFVGTLKGRSLA